MAAKKLGFGLMRLPLESPEDGNKTDYKEVCKMADRFLEAGFTYFDTATPYHGGNSELSFRECVAKRHPRSAYTITDKLSIFMIKKKEDIPGFFDAQFEHCGVDYFDYYLLHALSKDAFKRAEEMDAFNFMAQKKAEGRLKHIGFSFHDKAEVLDEILTKHPDMEYVQLQLNYIDWEDENIQSRRCYEVCQKHNKPVFVMEPVKGGLLADVPQEAKKALENAAPGMSCASWAVRFAASLENVVMVLSGMSNIQQLEDNISYMEDFKPLNESEKQLLKDTAGIIKSKKSIACTACRYCVDGCPEKIAIPDYFRLANNVSQYGEAQKVHARNAYNHHINKEGKGRASACIKCRQCEQHCPQHLPITKYLEDVAGMFEV